MFAREKGSISNVELRQISGLETLAASTQLRRLRDAGLLEQREKGTATYYLPTERLIGFARQLPLALPQGSTTLPQGSTSLPQGSRPAPHPLRREDWLQLLPSDLRARVEALPSRSPAEVVRGLLVDLCRWRPLASFELALIVQKEPTHIIRAYLSPMVEDRLLERTFPENPSHPRQEYRATAQRGPTVPLKEAVLEWAKKHGEIRRPDLVEHFHLGEKQATRLLARLVSEGRLLREGDKRWARYARPKRS